MESDAELSVIAHYLSKGHTLEEMAGLTHSELLIYAVAWELEAERLGKSIDTKGG